MIRWLPVVGYEGIYEVSSEGVVRSVLHMTARGPRGGKIISTSVGGRCKNYRRVMLNSVPRSHAYVHHLVCEAFHGPRPEGYFACHKNDRGMDNRAENLYWGSAEDNACDKSFDPTLYAEAPF
jgi:hypothetical protein